MMSLLFPLPHLQARSGNMMFDPKDGNCPNVKDIKRTYFCSLEVIFFSNLVAVALLACLPVRNRYGDPVGDKKADKTSSNPKRKPESRHAKRDANGNREGDQKAWKLTQDMKPPNSSAHYIHPPKIR